MSLQDYQKAKVLIQERGGDFEGPKTAALVESAERALGLNFPPTYRHFLMDLGCGDIGGVEVYGVINDKFEGSSVPNGIWLTLHERRNLGLPATYVLIGDSGDGSYYAIDASVRDESGESPVVRLSVDGKQSEAVASDFGAYLLDAVRAAV